MFCSLALRQARNNCKNRLLWRRSQGEFDKTSIGVGHSGLRHGFDLRGFGASDRQPGRRWIGERLCQKCGIQAVWEALLELRQPASSAVLGKAERVGVVRATVATQVGDGLA